MASFAPLLCTPVGARWENQTVGILGGIEHHVKQSELRSLSFAWASQCVELGRLSRDGGF